VQGDKSDGFRAFTWHLFGPGRRETGSKTSHPRPLNEAYPSNPFARAPHKTCRYRANSGAPCGNAHRHSSPHPPASEPSLRTSSQAPKSLSVLRIASVDGGSGPLASQRAARERFAGLALNQPVPEPSCNPLFCPSSFGASSGRPIKPFRGLHRVNRQHWSKILAISRISMCAFLQCPMST